tara:strand:+ start:28527 stop:29633 length:1107 start_codon:yes stop_codon:yes gene_type:complete
MKKIAILSIRNYDKAPRIDREIKALSNDFEIELFGENQNNFTNYKFNNIYDFRTNYDRIINKFFKRSRFSLLKKYLVDNGISVLIIHEPIFLKLAVQLKKEIGIKIVFNAHEYHPLEFEDIPGWIETKGKKMRSLYETYLSELDLFINVSAGIKEKCKQEFGIDSIVIPNASYYQELPIKNCGSFPIKMVHHGVILPSRQIEKMIETVKILGKNFTLDIIGVTSEENKKYVEEIKKQIDKTTNVCFLEPVVYSEIIPRLNKYDLGFYFMVNNSFNNSFALPNKLFEFIQARLAIAITPISEMKVIIEKHNIGIVSKESNVDSMVESLKNLNFEEVQKYKEETVKAAKIESADEYQKLFLKNILSLVSN